MSQCDGSQGVLLGYMGPALANNSVTQNIIVSEATERSVSISLPAHFWGTLAEFLTNNHNMTGSRSHSFTRPTTLQAASPMARSALLSTAICTHTPPNKPLTAPISTLVTI